LRRLPPLLLAAALLPAPVAAQEGPPAVPDKLRALSVTPPGQDGTITSEEFATEDYGPHFSDQLEMYASLVDDDDVTDAELTKYFHSMQFGVEGEVERQYQPTEGVTVYRDSFGIPHIYADSLDNASFALGYVTAEDRMFQMDVFRHAARGTLASFAGPGNNDAFVRRDIETRREGYTEAEVQKLYDDLDDRFGEVGKTIQTGLQRYADGVNEYIAEMRLDPSKRPFEYEGTGNTVAEDPEDWSPIDTMYIVILQLRVFGETAGAELQNAGLYAHLVDKHGKTRGTKVYNDILFQNDPSSPTTLVGKDGRFETQDLGRVDPDSFAVPDKAEALARRAAKRELERQAFLEGLGFKKQASNALLVSARKSASGNPLLLGGPQVGHALPSFFLDVDVHAPGVDFRGPAVPGTSVLIPLGRGADYAWTLTTGYSDAVDTRAELLCDPNGGEPTKESNAYMFKGDCVSMESREETIEVNPTPTDPGPPRSETVTIYRTVHGPVFERGTVGGKPVAFVKQRFFWMKETDSIPPFYVWNTQTDSIKDFEAAAARFTMSFNAFYADHKHIGYFHVGEYPLRPRGFHPSLPTWGTGEWEWKGRRPYRTQPKAVDPALGWVANWNNRPARGWDNHDSVKWGSVQRVELLLDHMHRLLDNGKAKLSDIVDVIRVAATRDADAVYLGPKMLKKAGRAARQPKEYRQALKVVRDWIKVGAHRRNKDRDDTMDNGAALAIFDEWYRQLVHLVFDDELGEDGYALIYDGPIKNYNPKNGGGFWFDFASYLNNMLTRKLRLAHFEFNYCNNLTTKSKETCLALVQEALTKALAKLKEEQGDDMKAWTTPAENISFTDNANSTTAGSVPDIPWQNRGSENHVVEVRDDV